MCSSTLALGYEGRIETERFHTVLSKTERIIDFSTKVLCAVEHCSYTVEIEHSADASTKVLIHERQST
jgi:hypothetical protein